MISGGITLEVLEISEDNVLEVEGRAVRGKNQGKLYRCSVWGWGKE